jgi:hypothetical protein
MIKDLNMVVSDVHIYYLTNIVKYKNVYENRMLCMRLEKPASKNAKLWWQYFYRCILSLLRIRIDKGRFIIWSHDVNVYKRIYTKKLTLHLNAIKGDHTKLIPS